MSDLTRFAQRRPGQAFEYSHAGLSYHVVVNRFPDNSIGELFLDAGKTGSHADIVADEAAILFSIARRFGAPAKEILDSLPKLANGKMAGPLGTALKMAGEQP